MKMIEFTSKLGKLKKLKRAGWVRFKIPQPESVADHSFRTAMLAMFIAPKVGADTNKAMKMALIHDLGEADLGDIITSRGKVVSDNLSSKIRNERKALYAILSLIDQQEYISLFDEYEENVTKEARLVKGLDKLEMVMQAYEYEKEYKINLQEFFDNAQAGVDGLYLKELLSQILELRKNEKK